MHLSLWQGEKNIFMGDSGSRFGMSEIGQEFMAGVLHHLPSLLAFICPMPNRYGSRFSIKFYGLQVLFMISSYVQLCAHPTSYMEWSLSLLGKGEQRSSLEDSMLSRNKS